jgi:iron complex outermembrane recepter protein
LGQSEEQGCIDQVQDLSGEAPPRAPELVFNLGGTYETKLTDTLSVALNLDTNFTDGHNVQENNNPVAYQDSFWRLNASVQLYSAAGWELALMGRNLTNEYYMESSTDKPVGGPGEIGVGLPRPREVVVQAAWRF